MFTAVLVALLGSSAARALDVAAVAPADLASLASSTFTFDPAAASARLRVLQSQSASEIGAAETSPAASGEPFGTEGTRYWLVSLGVGDDFKDHQMIRGGAALGYFLDDHLSIDLELNLMHFNQDDSVDAEDALGVNLNLLFRWHFMRDEARTWSLYSDAGAGLLMTDEDVPTAGKSFNFTPQLGIGASFDLGAQSGARLYTGVRWHHVSNANVFDENPGVDLLLVYAAVGFPF